MREEEEKEGGGEERRDGQGDVAHPPPHLASLIVHSACGAVRGEMAAGSDLMRAGHREGMG